MKSYSTPGGKTISLVRVPNTVLLKAQFKEGGELPQELSGMFTSEREAEHAINVYLGKPNSVKSNKDA